VDAALAQGAGRAELSGARAVAALGRAGGGTGQGEARRAARWLGVMRAGAR
jgi:hypothetical protein